MATTLWTEPPPLLSNNTQSDGNAPSYLDKGAAYPGPACASRGASTAKPNSGKTTVRRHPVPRQGRTCTRQGGGGAGTVSCRLET